MSGPWIVVLTARGEALGRRLAEALGQGEVVRVAGQARPLLASLFQAGEPLVCIMALGIAVRILGPLTGDKTSEPAVVVVDEAGRFAVSVLGGHAAGANALARRIAGALGATAVITTASDVLGLPAVDLIGQGLGWQIEAGSDLTAVAAAVVAGRPIAVYQDAGSPNWWQEFGSWPANFVRTETWPPQAATAALAISDRVLAAAAVPTVTYRPPTLLIGVGCRRGVPREEIEDLFEQVCRSHRLAPGSLAGVATVSLKADEPGLKAFAAERRVPLMSFLPAALVQVGPLPTPSERVRAKVGLAGVAEPAALLAAGVRELLVTKQRGRRVTLAVARREDR